eukprot:6190150-Pleurochrysis_carterae.AAC.1
MFAGVQCRHFCVGRRSSSTTIGSEASGLWSSTERRLLSRAEARALSLCLSLAAALFVTEFPVDVASSSHE